MCRKFNRRGKRSDKKRGIKKNNPLFPAVNFLFPEISRFFIFFYQEK